MRVVVFCAPLASSVIFTWLAGEIMPPERLGVHRLVWIGLVFVAANVLLVVVGRLTRRLVPLVALMKLTLVFPDHAPSRTKAALRRSNSKTMLRHMEEARARGETSGEALHGDYLVQLLKEVNDHDRLTRGHSERVRAYSEMLGEELGLGASDMNKLRWSALLHDVGKLAVPWEILNKDGRPTDDEWKLLSGHPAAARPMLEPLAPWLGEWIHAADQHHCRWDGHGYPDVLAGEDISLPGRLVAIADAYDVMTSARSYKKPLSPELARQELTDCAGSQFDPALVKAFLRIGLGRLKTVAGPLAWLANLTGSAQIPVPAATAVSSTAWSAGIATLGMTVAALGGLGPDNSAPPPDLLAFESPTTIQADDVAVTRPENEVPPETSNEPSSTLVDTVTVEVDTPTPTTTTTLVTTPTASPTTTTTTVPVPLPTTTTTTTTAVPTPTQPTNIAPTAIDDTLTVAEDASALISVLDNDSDPNAHPLFIAGVGSPLHGTASIESEQVRYVPTRDYEGPDQFIYTVSDGVNPPVAATVFVTVTGVNDPPVAMILDAAVAEATAAGTAVTSVSATDADGDSLSFAIATGDPASVFTIDAGGVVRVAGPLDHETTPSYTLGITVSDAETAVNLLVTITVTDIDEPPIAGDDSAVTSEDTPRAIVLGVNDTDPEGGTLTWNTPAMSSAGGALIEINGTVSYTPVADFSGADSFSYTVTDPAGNVSTPATVTIVVAAVNDPPIASDDTGPGYTTPEDTPLTTPDLTVNDTDVDHGVDPVSVSLVTGPSNGAVIDNGDGTVTYTPNPDWSGTDTFTYTIADPDGAISNTATVTVVVTAVNDAPVAGNDLLTVDMGAAGTTADVRLNDTDTEAGPLTVVAVSNGTNGTTIDNGNGTITYTHDGTPTLSDTFTYTIADSGGLQATATVTVTVVPPEDNDGRPAALDNCPVSFNPDQTDTDNDNIGDVCDPDPTATSTSTFTDTVQNLGDGRSFAVAIADVDADGDPDAVYANSDDPNAVWINDGTGTFTDSGQTLGTNKSVAVVAADLDNDSDMDLIFANDVNEPNRIWLNNGTGTFTDTGQTLGSRNTEDAAVGDFDSDGDLDLVFANDNGPNTIWLNNGAGIFADTGQALGSNKGAGVAVGDVDGDGDLDLAFAHDGEDNTVWFNNGTGVFTDSGQSLGSGRSHDLALVDLDDDGDLDLAIAEDNDGDSIWLNDGAGTFTDTGQTLGLGHSRALAVGDLDGDGDPDIIFGDHTGENSVWLNNGTGTFTDSTQRLANHRTEGLVIADVNNDGTLDLLTANENDPNLVWLNS